MGLKFGAGQNVDTHITILEKMLRVDCGCETPEEKARHASELLGYEVKSIEDLTVKESAQAVYNYFKFMRNEEV